MNMRNEERSVQIGRKAPLMRLHTGDLGETIENSQRHHRHYAQHVSLLEQAEDRRSMSARMHYATSSFSDRFCFKDSDHGASNSARSRRSQKERIFCKKCHGYDRGYSSNRCVCSQKRG